MDGDLGEEFGWESARLLDELFEVFAFDVFHGNVDVAIVERTDIVDGDDIDVLEGGRGTRFAHEVFERDFVVFELIGEDFECDGAHEECIGRFVDDAHSAVSDFFNDAITFVADGGDILIAQANRRDAISRWRAHDIF